jgi:hypothetical protein
MTIRRVLLSRAFRATAALASLASVWAAGGAPWRVG